MSKPVQIPDFQLEPQRIIETIRKLERRIQERFPDSGLGALAERLDAISVPTVARLEWVARPLLPLRIAIGLCVFILIGLPVGLLLTAKCPAGRPDFFELIQTLEAGVNDLIFIGLVLFFLLTLESRIKRRRALHFLRELRALAHIIDMHQLTKDPDRVSRQGIDTPSSPPRELRGFQLARYLDYCSEMLSLVSKIAALYAQSLDDPVVLAAVDEVESLTVGLSGKIWQKIVILDRTIAPNRSGEAAL